MVRQKFLSVGAILAVLVIAYLMDRIVQALKLYTSQTFRTTIPFAIITLFELLFAGMVVFLFWFMLVRNHRSSLIGWICIAVGLVAFFISSPFHFYLSSWLYSWFNTGLLLNQIRDLPFFQRNYQYLLRNILFFLNTFTTLGFFTDAGAFTIALGVAALLRKPKGMLPEAT